MSGVYDAAAHYAYETSRGVAQACNHMCQRLQPCARDAPRREGHEAGRLQPYEHAPATLCTPSLQPYTAGLDAARSVRATRRALTHAAAAATRCAAGVCTRAAATRREGRRGAPAWSNSVAVLAATELRPAPEADSWLCTVALHAPEQSDRAPEPLGFAPFDHAGASLELGTLRARARAHGTCRRARPFAARHAWFLSARPEPRARVRSAASPKEVLQHRCVPPVDVGRLGGALARPEDWTEFLPGIKSVK